KLRCLQRCNLPHFRGEQLARILLVGPCGSKMKISVWRLAGVLLIAGRVLSQEATPNASTNHKTQTNPPWEVSFTLDGYLLPDGTDYASPIVAADRSGLHLEARYNYEDRRTGSLWAGYNFSAGEKLLFRITPMIGGVFGRTTGIAPGCEASLSYKRVELSISNEYVFDTT